MICESIDKPYVCELVDILLTLELLRVVGCGFDSTGSVYDPVVGILNVVIHLRVPYKTMNFLTILASVSCPRAQLFGVSK